MRFYGETKSIKEWYAESRRRETPKDFETGESTMMDRHKEALAEQEYAVRMRRDFHQNPELSGEEVRTSARI